MERRSFFKAAGGLCGLLWLLVTHSLSFGEGFPKAGKDDRCPVCGMFVHKYPKWAAGFVFQSGARYFHCCPKCMLHNLHQVSKYQPGETSENIRQIWVTEYYTTKQTEAREVFFVVSTNLVGPMGLDLIPVRGKAAAENLKRDYDGELILSLDQITPDEISKARSGRLKRKSDL
ncbi:MAG: nitrous oxide reductase accessory protein NosL [Desulfomonile tiedjei]|uniref:Nitrous oxide reductase accessory protein NosL n=1 Tax=Desulfomonile tiedjei TaxID=2358 RepID=A0A9D6Z2L0_9BACT|nr:nitrous oxide reductase accessory protein NosL [Desulfomonile tiedjei]